MSSGVQGRWQELVTKAQRQLSEDEGEETVLCLDDGSDYMTAYHCQNS